MGLFTLCICFAQREIRVSPPGCIAPCMCSSSVYKQEWSAVTVALFAQRLMPSVWMCLASQALGPEIENGERHIGLIDPASLISEDDGEVEKEDERRKKVIGELLLSSPYWAISGQGLFTKYCGVLFC